MSPVPDRERWAIRFGILSGGAAGLLATFGAAWLVDKSGGDPEWLLRLGSAVGLLGGGFAGRSLGRHGRGALYAPLGIAAGLLISGALTILYLAAVGANR